MSWKVFKTPQIPSTLPPLEAVLQNSSESEARARLEDLGNSIQDGLNVLPLNAIISTIPQILGPFYGFLLRSLKEGVKFISLNTVAESLGASGLPTCDVVEVNGFGSSKNVAMQSLE
jgi:hypothetical protein